MKLKLHRLQIALSGEIPLFVWTYGLGILLQPNWRWEYFYSFVPVAKEVWGTTIISLGVLGYISLYKKWTRVWRIFLGLDIFLFTATATSNWWNNWTAFFIYLSLAYCCTARLLEFNSSGLAKKISEFEEETSIWQ